MSGSAGSAAEEDELQQKVIENENGRGLRETGWAQVPRLEGVIPCGGCEVLAQGSVPPLPPSPYLFAASEAKRSFRISKTMRKMAEKGEKRSQPKPPKAKSAAGDASISLL
jgi:hypothetical protein